MRPYEMMIVLAPDVPEDELDPSIDTIEDYVTRVNGDVIAISRDSPWGRRRLAYPIRHAGRDVRDGYYALYYFDAEPNVITEIEREIRLNDRIIRHMIIALEEQVTILPPPTPEELAANAAAEGGDGEAPDGNADEDGAEDVVAEATSADELEVAESEPVVAETEPVVADDVETAVEDAIETTEEAVTEDAASTEDNSTKE